MAGIERGWLWKHESGTYVKLTQALTYSGERLKTAAGSSCFGTGCSLQTLKPTMPVGGLATGVWQWSGDVVSDKP
jgi:hypothetical protein